MCAAPDQRRNPLADCGRLTFGACAALICGAGAGRSPVKGSQDSENYFNTTKPSMKHVNITPPELPLTTDWVGTTAGEPSSLNTSLGEYPEPICRLEPNDAHLRPGEEMPLLSTMLAALCATPVILYDIDQGRVVTNRQRGPSGTDDGAASICLPQCFCLRLVQSKGVKRATDRGARRPLRGTRQRVQAALNFAKSHNGCVQIDLTALGMQTLVNLTLDRYASASLRWVSVSLSSRREQHLSDSSAADDLCRASAHGSKANPEAKAYIITTQSESDSLHSVAYTFDLSVEKLREMNPLLRDCDKFERLRVGSLVRIAPRTAPASRVEPIPPLAQSPDDDRVLAVPDHFMASGFSGARSTSNRGFHLDLGPTCVAVRVVEGFFLSGMKCMAAVNLSALANVTCTGEGFLGGCSELTELDVTPLANVIDIGPSFLVGCHKLRTITSVAVAGSVVDHHRSACTTGFAAMRNVKRIGKSFLKQCRSLTEVTLPHVGHVESIGERFAQGCMKLKSVTIGPIQMTAGEGVKVVTQHDINNTKLLAAANGGGDGRGMEECCELQKMVDPLPSLIGARRLPDLFLLDVEARFDLTQFATYLFSSRSESGGG